MDIADQISSLLNSPDGMDKIRSVAANLLGGDGGLTPETNKSAIPQNSAPQNSMPALPDLLSGAENMGNIMRLISLLNGQSNDKRVNLLLALKPHLSEERSKKIDKAVSIIKIASLLPILKSEGILENLL